jgi:outer membrane lipoprotein-sorting protein
VTPYLIEQLLLRGSTYPEYFGDTRLLLGVTGIRSEKDDSGPFLAYTVASTVYGRGPFIYKDEGASVKLWYDPKTNIPLKRQLVKLDPDQDVRVATKHFEITELFKEVSLNKVVPDDRFLLDEKK